MTKQYMIFLLVHIFNQFLILVGGYMSAGAPKEFYPVKTWFEASLAFFIMGMLFNLIFFIINRKKEGNLKAFLVTTPIMIIPYLLNLIPFIKITTGQWG
ncbi:hypothetical protein [Alkalihalobacterium bogoriense]|uniref:hypothetical protein n=1 Tax=Alkalihalobacterium bogoriense TaxID=246272 RepID=UPI00047B22C0|nr:hypothetical protein [Alkalihalobacterium bogoriense]